MKIHHRHKRSSFEKQVAEYIKSIVPNALYNDRIQIKPYELDIYLPYLNLAFECNGEFFHDDFEREMRKINRCNDKGITLHIIWYNDWQSKQEIIKYLIKQIIDEKLKTLKF